MIPPGAYHFSTPLGSSDWTDKIEYNNVGVGTIGGCDIIKDDDKYGDLDVYAGIGMYLRIVLPRDCQGEALTGLVAPRVGGILLSGQCAGKDKWGAWTEVWALYWGGVSNAVSQRIETVVDVRLHPAKHRDSVADATAVVQMVLDFIDRSYAADPTAAYTPPPGPSPSPTPSLPSETVPAGPPS
jgi:hypothetical protein